MESANRSIATLSSTRQELNLRGLSMIRRFEGGAVNRDVSVDGDSRHHFGTTPI